MSRRAAFFIVNLLILATTAQEQSCTTDESCQYFIEGSKCDNDVCKCVDGTVLSSDETKCLAGVDGYGGACEETVQCSDVLKSGGVCADGVCTCKDNFHYLQGRCWKSVPLGGDCLSDDQCFGAYDFVGFQCLDGKCQCREQYYERGGGCRRISGASEDCAFDFDCNCDGGKCTNRVCVCSNPVDVTPFESAIGTAEKVSAKDGSCEPGSFPVDGVCYPELGSDCKDKGDEFCSDGINYSKCVDNRVCACSSVLRSGSPDNRSCMKAAAAYNGTCTTNAQCSSIGENGICITSHCVCTEASHYDEAIFLCRTSKYIGDACEEDIECVTTSGGNIACLSNICTCTPGSHQAADNKDCRPDSSHVGEVCVEDSDCMFPNAVCDTLENVCRCTEHFYADNDGLCQNGVGSTCSSTSDCDNIVGTSCRNSTCQCQENYVSSVNYQTCLEVAEYGGECQQDDQCDPLLGDLKLCQEGKCACSEGAQYILSKCYNKILLGEKCKARAECVPEGGELDAYMCQNAICACQYGYQREGNICIESSE